MTTREQLLARLGDLHALWPNVRFGQLIANMAFVARGAEPGAIWDMEDEELLQAVNWQIAEFVDRGRTADQVAERCS